MAHIPGMDKHPLGKMLISFMQSNRKITIQGDQRLSCGDISNKEMKKTLVEKQLLLIELHQMETMTEDMDFSSQGRWEDEMHQSFLTLFALPMGIPLERERGGSLDRPYNRSTTCQLETILLLLSTER